MPRPLIGLTPGHNTENQDIFMRPTYLKALSDAGAIPVVLPLVSSDEDLEQLVRTFDGFLFTGGPDPHPFLFGEETHRSCGNISVRRDSMETALLKKVMKTGKPVFGICRGIQIINVVLGGNLYQDIRAEYQDGQTGDAFPVAHSQPCDFHTPAHTVTLSPDSRLAQICGCRTLKVNSMHHQAVRDLAPGLAACAIASDGLIEAVEMPGYPWLTAVQWHPEYLLEDPAARRIFENFAASCLEGAKAFTAPGTF